MSAIVESIDVGTDGIKATLANFGAVFYAPSAVIPLSKEDWELELSISNGVLSEGMIRVEYGRTSRYFLVGREARKIINSSTRYNMPIGAARYVKGVYDVIALWGMAQLNKAIGGALFAEGNQIMLGTMFPPKDYLHDPATMQRDLFKIPLTFETSHGVSTFKPFKHNIAYEPMGGVWRLQWTVGGRQNSYFKFIDNRNQPLKRIGVDIGARTYDFIQLDGMKLNIANETMLSLTEYPASQAMSDMETWLKKYRRDAFVDWQGNFIDDIHPQVLASAIRYGDAGNGVKVIDCQQGARDIQNLMLAQVKKGITEIGGLKTGLMFAGGGSEHLKARIIEEFADSYQVEFTDEKGQMVYANAVGFAKMMWASALVDKAVSGDMVEFSEKYEKVLL